MIITMCIQKNKTYFPSRWLLFINKKNSIFKYGDNHIIFFNSHAQKLKYTISPRGGYDKVNTFDDICDIYI